MSSTQKSVLITGSSEGGIGDALAREFHRRGLRVFASARNLSKVQHLKDMGLEVLQLDVLDDASIKQAVEAIKSKTGGKLDFLVNNSGGGYSLPMLDTTLDGARKVFELNVFSLVAVTQAFSSLLMASKGTIINIGSVAGVSYLPWQGYYNATKAAVASISNNLRVELAPWDIKVINVITGGVKTHFFDNLPTQQLPSNSVYTPAKDEIQPFISGTFVDKSCWEVNRYAKTVVDNALKKSPKVHLWAGGDAWTIWFMSTFAWATFWDFFFQGFAKLPLVKSKIQAAEKSK